jgi:hypothetical protein
VSGSASKFSADPILSNLENILFSVMGRKELERENCRDRQGEYSGGIFVYQMKKYILLAVRSQAFFTILNIWRG